MNDLDRREILAGALERLADVPAAFRERIASADKRFVDATQPADRCVPGANRGVGGYCSSTRRR